MDIPILSRLQRKMFAQASSHYYTLFDGFVSSGYSSLKNAVLGYEKNIVVCRCIKLIMNGMTQIEFFVEQNGKEIEKHPMKALLDKPFPMMAGAEFLKTWVMYYQIHGNAYIWCRYTNLKTKRYPYSNKPPIQLYPLRPDLVEVKPGVNFLPSQYEYWADNSEKLIFPVGQVGESNIIHLKDPSPSNELTGLSSITNAAHQIDAHSSTGEYMHYLLENGVKPSGYLKVPVDVTLTKADKDRIKEELTQSHAGAKNAGRPMVLEGGIEWIPMSMTPHESEIQDTKKQLAHDIGLAFGVPIALLNQDPPKYDNMDGAREQLYEDAVFPLAKQYIDQINMDLAPRYGDNVKLCMRTGHINAIQTRQTNRMLALSKVSFLTDNEKRAGLGYDEIEGGDELRAMQPGPETDDMKARHSAALIGAGFSTGMASKISGVIYDR